MIPILKIFFKMFVFRSFFWCFVVLINPIWWPNYYLIFLYGAGIAAVTTIIPIVMHVKKLKEMGINEFTDDVLSTNQSKVIESTIDPEMFLQRLETSRDFSRLNIVSSNVEIKLDSDIMDLRSSIRIQIYFRRIRNGLVEYRLSCRPKITIPNVDRGMSLQNIKNLELLLMDD